MKRIIRIMGLCALVALAATSCKKDEQKLTSTFTAELTQPTSNAKTHLGSDSYLYWNSGDAIKVFDANGTAYEMSTTDNNVKEATFTSETTLDANESYIAFYPAAATAKQDNEIRLILPTAQTFAVGSFGNSTYPMAAVNNGTNFTFHSQCGVLAIPVKGTGNIGSIELTGKVNENLAGQLRYGLDGSYLGFNGEGATVTLDCGNIALDATNATTFYFVLPKDVFANGFKAVLKNGTTELYTLETAQPNTIAAETIKLMPEVTVESITVTTIQTDNVGWTGACLYGSYVAPTGMSVTEYGFYWGEDANPTTKVVGEPDAENPLKFEKFLLGLTDGTTYYYKAYVKNGENEYVGEVKNFTTTVQVGVPSVMTSDVVTNLTATGAVCGGTVTDLGNNGILVAYGIKYSTDANMSTGVVDVAGTDYDEASGNFIATLTGLTGNTTYYYRAYVTNQSYNNLSEIMSFTTPAALPIGIINGLFSVSATQQVYFSQGNLQYQASTNTWQFAEHQYNYVGNANSSISQTNSGWIDLFGWGTSGYNHGANAYQPWSTSMSYSDYYAYGNWEYNLYDQNGQADWGHNAISNGGNAENSGWRTLTQPEWSYVFFTRTTTSGIRYAKATVNGVSGVVLLPDNWTASIYALNNTNSVSANYTINTITAADWTNVLEVNGAVFLPAGGYRGISVYYVGSYGGYWSSSYAKSHEARGVYFNDGNIYTYDDGYRYFGHSVRLVRDVE